MGASEKHELSISFGIGDKAADVLRALPQDRAKALFSEAIGEAIAKAADPESADPAGAAAEPVPERQWKRAIVQKDAGEQRYVLGVVAEPESEDTQGDKETEVTIEKAAHGFMEAYADGYGTDAERGHVGKQHKSIVDGKVVVLESYIAPTDMTFGEQTVKKGAWLMAVRVRDDQLWEEVKKGDLTGFSFGGTAVRRPDKSEEAASAQADAIAAATAES